MVYASSGASQQPSNTSEQQFKDAQQAGTTIQPLNLDERGTIHEPLVVSPLVVKTYTQKSDGEIAAEDQERRERSNTDWWTIRIGIATIFILLVQTIVFGVQAIRLKQTVKTMNQIANEQRQDVAASLAISDRGAGATERAVDRMRESAIFEMRAYVFLQLIQFKWHVEKDETIGYVFSLLWKNSGKTATKDMQTNVVFDLREGLIDANFDFVQATSGTIGHAFIAPGEPAGGGPVKFLKESDMKDIKDGRKFFYIYGRAKYFDVFDGTPQRVTKFCYLAEVTGDPHTPIVENPIKGLQNLNGVTVGYRLQSMHNSAT